MALFELSESVFLDPTPGFVVKSRVLEGKGEHTYSTKVFINICHDSQVPKPRGEFDPQVVFPLIVKNEWEIPLLVLPEKKASDKKGVPSFVYDCCINSECFQWIQVNVDLRLILIEWCIESVELMHVLSLDREYAVPKMLAKGELSKTEISKEELKTGFQKKLQDLKENEALAMCGESEEEIEETELPDLMDIGSKRGKPLIQEIGEMSLEVKSELKLSGMKLSAMSEGEKKTGLKHSEIDISGPNESGISEHISEISTISTATASPAAPSSEVPYTYVVTTQTRSAAFFFKFESPQLTPKVTVEYDRQNQMVVLINKDATRVLNRTNRLEIAIPGNATPHKCFLVEKEMALYVFCHLPRSDAH